MMFRQFLHESLSAASYLIGCPASGEALVVDPGLPAEQYALVAADRGVQITAIFETHLHADYISTGRALARLTGARIYAPRAAELLFPHEPLDDQQTVQVGNIVVRAIHTPGHTPEHMAYAVADTPRSTRPWFVLTGDCLFVGDVGRADLVDLPMTGPEFLYRSVQALLKLSDDTEVFPAHYGGSACGGKGMSGKPSSTIGFERRHNRMLGAPDAATFARWLADTPRAAVDAVLTNRNTNRGAIELPAGYGRSADDQAAPLSVHAAADLVRRGVVLLDLRDRLAFAAGHARGAINIGYNRDALIERVGALTTPDDTLITCADQPFLARHAAALLAQAGRNHVHGYLDAAVDELTSADLPFARLPTLSVDDLHRRAGDGALVLDVREPYEWQKGVVAGARLISFAHVRSGLAGLPRQQPLVTVCESGTRAGAVASLLLRQGFGQVENVAPDGMGEYARRYPTVAPTST